MDSRSQTQISKLDSGSPNPESKAGSCFTNSHPKSRSWIPNPKAGSQIPARVSVAVPGPGAARSRRCHHGCGCARSGSGAQSHPRPKIPALDPRSHPSRCQCDCSRLALPRCRTKPSLPHPCPCPQWFSGSIPSPVPNLDPRLQIWIPDPKSASQTPNLDPRPQIWIPDLDPRPQIWIPDPKAGSQIQSQPVSVWLCLAQEPQETNIATPVPVPMAVPTVVQQLNPIPGPKLDPRSGSQIPNLHVRPQIWIPDPIPNHVCVAVPHPGAAGSRGCHTRARGRACGGSAAQFHPRPQTGSQIWIPDPKAGSQTPNLDPRPQICISDP
ncbi:keratinocyte proline-rich protein-like isoform X2 [Catharus ustulatus]|nr:keratinocyte proline-rich protein-like isoform X2 [Catharus ustulatus]